MSRPLTVRQRRFVNEFALSRNGAAAAARAGYAAGSAKVAAARLLTKANVRAALSLHEAEAANRFQASRERVIEELLAAVDLAKMKRDPAAMVAAWREIAKICGLYTPERLQCPAADQVSRGNPLEALTDRALLTLLATNDAAPMAA